MGSCGLVMGCCEHDDESPIFIKAGMFCPAEWPQIGRTTLYHVAYLVRLDGLHLSTVVSVGFGIKCCGTGCGEE